MSLVTYAVAARSDGVTMWVVLLGRSASVAMVFRALLLDSGHVNITGGGGGRPGNFFGDIANVASKYFTGMWNELTKPGKKFELHGKLEEP